MVIIESKEDFSLLDGNTLIGHTPDMAESRITIKGDNNVLFVEEGVTLRNTRIAFEGNNGLLMLGRNRHDYKLDVSINNCCSVVFGRDIYFNGACHIIVSEQRNVVFGDDCLVSFDVWIRTADPHLVFDCETHKRINGSRDVIVGDHVWLGQHAFLLKGSTIGSGSMIGAMSLVAGKTIPSNTSWGGNPAKQIRDKVFWEGSCVHQWNAKKTKKFSRWESSEFIFAPDDNDSFFSSEKPRGSVAAIERAQWYIDRGYDDKSPNRYAIAPKP